MSSVFTAFATAEQAEAAFYAAFNRCEPEAMAKVWADDNVVCVHPGSQAIVGYVAVMRSWTHILSDARLPNIQVLPVTRSVTETMAVHLVEEQISSGQQSASVLATNVYRKYEAGWLMVEHHGSLIHEDTQKHTLQ
ncbi:MAG: nuclear transport factor 2 family protein [Thioalkalispiraceae bacterium]|jgi:ketosteroid isomerase-like protein